VGHPLLNVLVHAFCRPHRDRLEGIALDEPLRFLLAYRVHVGRQPLLGMLVDRQQMV
jgi:hypothetical protein